ncbi:MAG: GTP cyclohydrolase II [Alphaproteobacteria bacterium]|nr:GTP cyclohydrolase II [Alphaproteobacteria bacterium]
MAHLDILHKVQRVLDALKRGEAVRLSGETATLCFMAGESWLAQPECGLELIIAEPRAHFLGWGGAAVAIPLREQHAAAEALIFSAAPPPPASAHSADPLQRQALRLLKEAGCVPAAVAIGPQTPGDTLGLTQKEAEAYWRIEPPMPVPLPAVHLPIAGAEDARAVGFASHEGRTHLALLIGAPETAPAPLARVHSSCFTGDILGSLRCDCGGQLAGAIQQMIADGAGILLYLEQEGRGIGLRAKLRAYALQDAGLDTVDANRALGFADDERDFTPAAQMLRQLHVSAIRLLTNNPRKQALLESRGIRVEACVPLLATHPRNEEYLRTKKARLGHRF